MFSAGFNSGRKGGKEAKVVLSGIMNDFSLRKAPLSKTIILNSSDICS